MGCSPEQTFNDSTLVSSPKVSTGWFPTRTGPLEYLNRSFTVLSSPDWECGKPIAHYGGINGVWFRTYAV